MLFSWVGLGLIVFYDKKKNDFFCTNQGGRVYLTFY